jgi:hypothetical protein
MRFVITLVLSASAIAPALAEDETSRPSATGAATQASSAPATQAAMPKELADALEEGIKLLEAGKHREAIERLAQPKELAKLKADRDFEQVVREFGRDKAPKLLAILKDARTQTPVLAEDGTRATFKAERKPITFVKDAGVWRVLNN